MNLVLKNAHVFTDGKFDKFDISVINGIIAEISPSIKSDFFIDCSGNYIFPGFVDVHVHLREPGFSYKETIKTGSLACAAGGYTSVCTMPNLNPVPDCYQKLKVQLDLIEKDASVKVYPFGSISVDEKGIVLSDFKSMAPFVAGFSDDGRGVQNDNLMYEAMCKAKKYNKIISAHCEVNELLNGGYIHDGEYAKINGHRGICSESEWGQIKRDIELVKMTGCKYHVCHISTKESVELIRQAKADGVDITCETGPHYLVMNDMQLLDEGRFKMNPPIRSEEDRLALIEGIKDGTIDMIATDHAPHSNDEKSKGLSGSLMGISGIETAFPILYTFLVQDDIISLEKLVELICINPSKRFNIGNEISVGNKADLTVFNLTDMYAINSEKFISMGKATPFEGVDVYGKCVMTLVDGEIVWRG